ncbi:hypothetical protein IQ265_05245 [Nodosilinea sp. LEGE 06152]|uniref:hypothetical protein n=1 Tax=Nodosilinea sp. LEGE 06152 TaxID=2777966 RepID=UPI00187E5C07|nr:hypothetical protein [Nodosilinea sp. LEGE 06152]MBE9156236.1 hypothetical protein [Nodosilinea sp. LEGE 06152]
MAESNGLDWWQRSLPALAAGLIALGLTGCNTLGLSRSPESDEDMGNQYVDSGFRGNTLVSRMKPVRLRLQNGWQAAPTGTLHPNADLEAYNPDQELFLVVLGESRAAVGQGNLEEQASNYLQILKGGFSQVTANQERTGVDRVNGFPAVQYAVRGEVSQRPVAYLHTTVEMGEEYYQVVVWAPDDSRMANADAMRSVVQEFSSTQQ